MSESLFDVAALHVGYPRLPDVIRGLDLSLPRGGFTAVVGPNGCGKSTLLLTLARLLRPASGQVSLHRRPLTSYPARDLARTLAFLPQQPLAPDGIRVRDLVMRGRQPYRRFLLPATAVDHAAVDAALAATGTKDLADIELSGLSGGQRQRVWIAMTLAQDTDVVLLDEPTSFLDIAHQVDVLEAGAALARSGRSVVAVLHDLGLAARYADHLVVMKSGRRMASGAPHDVVNEDLVHEVFGLRCRVVADPETGTPLVVPRRRAGTCEPDQTVPTSTDERTAHACT
ncbi:iron complex transport system ATP-binding protein [Kineosphaera limosa]|uniref:Putative iron-siderophore ABC transporter ATP-binding protein n=1 Tax=Kineosphaera limosa NBRC 100340 TaxID=1184609 RepID=K6X7Z7_9MICO|nr:ABC transporter ATP-binding protein [Kineosphaera limosa]NYE00876.1 iron complex transport system ATP-binding protein [Kineosphaera limosa]GAB94929.1 putative iron-siderophore ABC transporter ATP-binding protein [Kineosphaera limosa NBRC 100340]